MEHAFLDELFIRYPVLVPVREQIVSTYNTLRLCYNESGTIFLAGNGGSRADADHFAGELLKGFRKSRPVSAEIRDKFKRFPGGEELSNMLQEGIPTVPLGNGVLSTAVLNDIGSETVFAQHLYALGRSGDVLIGLSTSGNAKNVYNACVTAKALDMSVISFTGKTGGALLTISDICINVPETETYKVQELHLPVYHAICAQLEDDFFD